MKRNKKYNPLKHLTYTATHVLRNYAIGFITGQGGSVLINVKHNRIAPVDPTTVRLITEFPHMWSIYIACFGIDNNNAKYMKSNEVHLQEKRLQKDVVDTLNELHGELCSNFNKSHMVSAGWIATPYYYEWDEEKAFKILSDIGAFDFTNNEK
jgi:hypothetical protein